MLKADGLTKIEFAMGSPVSGLDPATAASPASGKPLIELGLVLVGRLDPVDREAIKLARRRVHSDLQRWFPDFAWQLVAVPREEISTSSREEPVSFLAQGQTERDVYKWDFVFVITGADLIGHDKPFALATVSRTLDLAVISTARIDPRATDTSVDSESRVKQTAVRLGVLMLRCLGHLNGLDCVDDPHNLMWDADRVEELDEMVQLTAEQISPMQSNLHAIADLRLEEQRHAASRSPLAFLLQAGWMQRREIIAEVLEAAPWQFPVRFNRLTTAAVSAMLVLLMTAETWDMSMSQSAASITALLLSVVVVTTAYVVTRQHLLIRRQDRQMTEQIAVSNLTATLTVLSGLVTMLITLFAASLCLSLLLFSEPVVNEWVTSVEGPVTLGHYLLLSGVVSGFSLSIGALGATFEDQSYFRHVTFIDEEL